MQQNGLNRRQFIAGTAGLAATAMSAANLTRAQGANDRIGIGIIGCGGRSGGFMRELMDRFKDQVDIVALCDVWKGALERTQGWLTNDHGQSPKIFQRHQDLLNLPEVDAVFIATPDFSHSPILVDAIHAGKDGYIEKPMSYTLEQANAALEATLAGDRIVQVGTQRRSNGTYRAAARFVQQGGLGQVIRVDSAWNRNIPSWARPYDDVRREDVDWEQYQMGMYDMPFDPARYRCWHLYYEYTTGLVGLLGSHMIDVASWFMDDPYPESGFCHGALLRWKDGRETRDTVESAFYYPKGWMCNFHSTLASGPETDFEIFHGAEKWMDSRNWQVRTAAHGRNPEETPERFGPDDPSDDYIAEWLRCIRERVQPVADIHTGHAHSVACCLARESEKLERLVRYDAEKRAFIV